MGFLPQPISITSLIFGKKRSIGDIEGYVTEKETTTDRLTITKQPIQDGAAITDHAFKEPTDLTIMFKMQPTGLSAFQGLDGLEALYQRFLELQDSREPIAVATPKRLYNNMLVAVISNETDKSTENILSLTITFQEIIVAQVGAVTVPKSSQGLPQTTQKTKRVGRKSVLNTLFGGNLQSVTGQIGGGG